MPSCDQRKNVKTLSTLGWLCLVAGLGFGCSKKSVPPDPAAGTAQTDAAAPAEAPATAPDPGAADGGYDAKVALALQATSGAPLTDAQKEAAARAERQLLDAVEKDPKAAEAYKNLQRARNGR